MHHDSNLLHCRVYSSHLDQKRFWNFMTAHNTHKNIHHSGLWTNLGLLSVFETDNVLFYKVVIKLIIHKMVMKGLLSPHHMAILDAIHKESLILILMTYVQLSTLVKFFVKAIKEILADHIFIWLLTPKQSILHSIASTEMQERHTHASHVYLSVSVLARECILFKHILF